MNTKKSFPSASEGKKFDNGKPKLGMVQKYFSRSLLEVSKVATYGHRKYGDGDKFWDYNWDEVADGFERYADAEARHNNLFFTGEVLDDESNLHHLAHAAWNALAKLEFALRKQQ